MEAMRGYGGDEGFGFGMWSLGILGLGLRSLGSRLSNEVSLVVRCLGSKPSVPAVSEWVLSPKTCCMASLMVLSPWLAGDPL